MEIIQKILSSACFEGRPPVLIDVGASGEMHAAWKSIAANAVCICFDADDRDFNIHEVENSGFKKLMRINRVVTAEETGDTEFYLTLSPYCSSTLKPLASALKPWMFSNYFDVKEKIKLQSTTIAKSLEAAGIGYADWLKLDTQGTDLRLYAGLPSQIKDTVLVAELEPGIIDAYTGEDKLHHVLEALHKDRFWLSKMEVKGTYRISKAYYDEFGAGNTGRALPVSPGWAELLYLKEADGLTDIRSLFLLYVFALMQSQYGFATEVCDIMSKQSDDPLIKEAKLFALDLIRSHDLKKLPFQKRVKNYLLRKLS